MLRYLCSRFKLIKSNRPWVESKPVHLNMYILWWPVWENWCPTVNPCICINEDYCKTGDRCGYSPQTKRCRGIRVLEKWLYIWLTWWTTLHTICWVHLECCCLNCWKKMRSAALPGVVWLLCNTIQYCSSFTSWCHTCLHSWSPLQLQGVHLTVWLWHCMAVRSQKSIRKYQNHRDTCLQQIHDSKGRKSCRCRTKASKQILALWGIQR